MRLARLLLLLALAAGAGWWYFHEYPERLPAWVDVALPAFPQLPKLPESLPLPEFVKLPGAAKPQTEPDLEPVPEDSVTLYLTNGGAATGRLVRESASSITLSWDYGEVDFDKREIRKIIKGKHDTDSSNISLAAERAPAEETWAYRHPVVARLMNGAVLDGAITAVTAADITVTRTLAGGGAAEQTVPRNDIETLLFKPVRNERSTAIAGTLATVFPAMRRYEEGVVTIITDSAPPAVKQYRRTIRELMTDWYLTFYPLVSRRSPSVQQHVVIFEDFESYVEYALTDGVPGWIMVGYFDPDDAVLYCFNILGERFSDLLYDAYLGQFSKARTELSAQLKGHRQEVFIEGQVS
jgi:hypothetical protein